MPSERHGNSVKSRGFSIFAVFAVCLCICTPAHCKLETRNCKLLWHGATLPLGRIDEQSEMSAAVSQTVGNAMLPMFLAGMARSKLTGMFGEMAPSRELRFAAFRVAGNGEGESGRGERQILAVVYPVADSPAEMLVRHPGSKLVSENPAVIVLPKGEGRGAALFAVYSADGASCAFAPRLSCARAALRLVYPAIADDVLCSFAAGSSSAQVSATEDGELEVFVSASDAESHKRLMSIPVAGRLFATPGASRLKATSAMADAILSLGKITE